MRSLWGHKCQRIFGLFQISLQFRFVYLCYVVIKSSRFLLIFYLLTGSYWPKHRERTPLQADTDYTAFLFFIFVFHDSPGQTMKVFPVLASRLATLHVWFRSVIICCLHVSIVHRLTARRVKGCQSWLQQQRHCVWSLAAFCSEKEKRREKKIVNPSRCVTMREMWAVCPSHSKNVIRLGPAVLVTIETSAGEHCGMFRSKHFTRAVTQIRNKNTGKWIYGKVLTRHWRFRVHPILQSIFARESFTSV